MQLKYSKSIKKRIITIELETVNFSPSENQILEEFGEPIIKIEKSYLSSYPVQIERKIKTGFKVKIKFDGTEDIGKAGEAANLFFEEIQEELTKQMEELMNKVDDAEIKKETGSIDIKY